MSFDWPTAETAWRVAGSSGRFPPPNTDHPAAMAPELTTTTLWPSSRSSATWPHRFSMAAGSTPPSASVMDEDPTLTTTVRDSPPGTADPPDPVTGLLPGLDAHPAWARAEKSPEPRHRSLRRADR